jgi:hypothetical protein
MTRINFGGSSRGFFELQAAESRFQNLDAHAIDPFDSLGSPPVFPIEIQ